MEEVDTLLFYYGFVKYKNQVNIYNGIYIPYSSLIQNCKYTNIVINKYREGYKVLFVEKSLKVYECVNLLSYLELQQIICKQLKVIIPLRQSVYI